MVPVIAAFFLALIISLRGVDNGMQRAPGDGGGNRVAPPQQLSHVVSCLLTEDRLLSLHKPECCDSISERTLPPMKQC